MSEATHSQATTIKKQFYRKWWFWLLIVIVVAVASRLGNDPEAAESNGPRFGTVAYESEETLSEGGAKWQLNPNDKTEIIFTTSMFSAHAKYRIDSDAKKVILYDWKESMHPVGDLTYVAQDDGLIRVVTNVKGMQFRLNGLKYP